MNPIKENAPAGTEAIGRTKRKMNGKSFPAYGQQFMAMRRSGKIPARTVMVTFDWKIARAYPRIVISDQTPAAKLNFDYLAGLPVKVVYRQKDAHRVGDVIDGILKVNPSCLATFALDLVDTGDAVTLIKPYQPMQIAEAA